MQKTKRRSRSAYRKARTRRRKRLFADYVNNASQNADNVNLRWAKILGNLTDCFGGSLANVPITHYGIDRPKPKRTIRQRANSASIVHDYRETIIEPSTGYTVPNPDRGKAFRPKPTKTPNLRNQQNRCFWVTSQNGTDYIVCDLAEYDIASLGIDAYFEPKRFDDFGGLLWVCQRNTLDVHRLLTTIHNACILDDRTTDSRNIANGIAEKLPKI